MFVFGSRVIALWDWGGIGPTLSDSYRRPGLVLSSIIFSVPTNHHNTLTMTHLSMTYTHTYTHAGQSKEQKVNPSWEEEDVSAYVIPSPQPPHADKHTDERSDRGDNKGWLVKRDSALGNVLTLLVTPLAKLQVSICVYMYIYMYVTS